MATLATSWLITMASPTRRLRSPRLVPPRGDQAYVRFTPASGQIADTWDVRFVPIATECTAAKAASLFDHLIGEGEQRGWHGEPEYSGGLRVDDQFKLADLHGPHCPR